MINDSTLQEIYVMMFALQTLHNRGITVKQTIFHSLRSLLLWYGQSGNWQYMELALLHMQACANMGFALDEKDEAVREILEITKMSVSDFVPRGVPLGKRVKINKTQIRGMIGKWSATKENPITVSQVVEDIIDKLRKRQNGRYTYKYTKKSMGKEETDVYELVINSEESYFFDVKNFRFYTFIEEERNDNSCHS